VHATDPDADMLARLTERLPDVRTSQSSAEEIPAGDRTYDVVVCAQAFHWFDHAKALPEIARVLRSAGRFSVVWNLRDERVPWVRRLGGIIGDQGHVTDPADVVESSGHFGETETAEFKYRQLVDKRSILDLVASRSNVATLAPPAREAKLAEVAAFYEEYGRGMDGMQLPYLTRCFRFRVGHAPVSEPGAVTDVVTEGSDDDLLLIDFR
jgi:SAM-dependent methyltransferase